MGWLGHRTIELESCASTNDEAARLAAEGAEHGTVVTALQQTRGRGRQGRTWQAPPHDGLFWSCILRPAMSPAAAAGLTLAAGIGACKAVRALGAHATLKWPNDLVAVREGRWRKLGGILTESATRGAVLEHVVVGIGINVTTAPADVSGTATSIRQEGGHGGRAALLAELTAQLEQWLDCYQARGIAGVAPTWLDLVERRCGLWVHVGGERLRAELVGLDPDGALLVKTTSTGTAVAVRSGEVELGEVIS